VKDFGVVRIFLAIYKKKLKNSTNKKVKKLQKLIKEVLKKKSKTEKNKGCTYMSRSIECAHRKYEKVSVHKK